MQPLNFHIPTIMSRRISSFAFIAIIGLLLISCDEENFFKPQDFTVCGKVEKGPFVSGSTITMQPMNSKMQPSGEMYSSVLQDHSGSFTFGSKEFDTPYASLSANGYFFNEVDGELSSGTLNLRSLVNLADHSSINVNLLTHLKYQRILHLVENGKNFTEANAQSQEELFTAFGLSQYANTDPSQFSITGGNEQAAALIIVSSCILNDRTEAEMTEYLAGLSLEFSNNGSLSTKNKAQIKEDLEDIKYRLGSIEDNIIYRYKELGKDVKVKHLEKVWEQIDQELSTQVSLEKTSIDVPNEGGTYTIKISASKPLSLTRPEDGFLNDCPSAVNPGGGYFGELYDLSDYAEPGISLQKELNDNVLTIVVNKLDSYSDKQTSIPLYDDIEEVARIWINQAGDKSIEVPMPKLSKDAQSVFAASMMYLGEAFQPALRIEQYYLYNKFISSVNQYIYPGMNDLSNSWRYFYQFNNILLQFQEADAYQLGVYQEILDVFLAFQYYNMVVFWGDVPYFIHFSQIEGYDYPYNSRIPANEIFSDLKARLQAAIEKLEEKPYDSRKDINDIFFVSKDVARILLADIYLYEHNYQPAAELLKKVKDNAFYSLDDFMYAPAENVTLGENNINFNDSKEIIFGLYGQNTTRSVSISIQVPSFAVLQSWPDVLLSLAECQAKLGQEAEARKYLDQVITAKNLSIDYANALQGITEMRKSLFKYTIGNFAFMKRNNLAMNEYGIEEYRLLLPIPEEELWNNPNITQNPGY